MKASSFSTLSTEKESKKERKQIEPCDKSVSKPVRLPFIMSSNTNMKLADSFEFLRNFPRT